METEEQLAKVRAAGYTEMQGYLFGPPRSATETKTLYFASADQSKASA